MAIRITHVRLVGEIGHDHIDHLWWTNPDTKTTGDLSRASLVSWIEDKNGTAYVEQAPGHRAYIGVRSPAQGPKYVQTHADGEWNNNLLALPRR